MKNSANILVAIIMTALYFTFLPIIPTPTIQASETKLPENYTNKTASNNLVDPPPAPSSVSISRGQSHNSVVVTWSAPTTPPANYTYQIDLINNISSVAQSINNINSNITNASFNNLSTGNYNAIIYTVVDNIKSNPAQSSVPISVALSPITTSTNFSDITKLPANFQTAIKWAASYTITAGYPDGSFHPVTPTTRGQMATFFHKLAGNPNIEGAPTNFTDITESVHKNDIDWLSTQDIAAGYSCTAKGVPVTTCNKKGDLVYYPQGKITRQQMATFLYKFAASPTMTPDEVNSYLSTFKDKKQIIASGQDTSIAWLLKNNITAGFTCTAKGKPEVECTKPGDIVFRPNYNATRQQIVLFLQKTANTLNLLAYLKVENSNPSTFLYMANPNRDQITKISFQNTLPECSNPTDVSADDSGGIIACVINNTEIVIGEAYMQVQANPNNSYLLSNLTTTNGVDIDLSNLDGSTITDMSWVFSESKLKSAPIWSNKFASAATNMSGAFYRTILPDGSSLPDGFGSAALNMNALFYETSFPNEFVFPMGFGSAATDMGAMFRDATLPITNFSLPDGFGSAALSMNAMFYHVTFPNGFSLPEKFGKAATATLYMFSHAILPNELKLPAGFGNMATNMQNMFWAATLSTT
ncbi:MAG: S-layer homology domain-containing protein, partial [Bifidobacteriaceae bacterium]|nr:S-layer homology domain-containing protein [Bifidobacteriaceae bacterium]